LGYSGASRIHIFRGDRIPALSEMFDLIIQMLPLMLIIMLFKAMSFMGNMGSKKMKVQDQRTARFKLVRE